LFIQNKNLYYKKCRDIPKFGLSNIEYAGFRDSHWDIQDPSAQLYPVPASDPHDEEQMEARPNQEEMEEAIINFLLLLEKQETKGFNLPSRTSRLVHIVSQLPKPAQVSIRSMYMADAVEAGFFPASD